jgi:hypothetical protein
MKINASFYIAVYQDGKRFPTISINDPKYQMLGNLSQGHLSESRGVIDEINNIQKVVNGELASYSFGGDDWCIINVEKGKSSIISGFDSFEPIEVPTRDILELLERWSGFLVAYESGMIPGLNLGVK